MSIYQEIILHEYKNPRHYGTLKGEVLTTTVKNPLCGDQLTFYARIKNNILTDIAYEGVGCAISIAAASLLTDALLGKTIRDIKGFTSEDVIAILGIELSPNRLKCALLPLEGIVKVLDTT